MLIICIWECKICSPNVFFKTYQCACDHMLKHDRLRILKCPFGECAQDINAEFGSGFCSVNAYKKHLRSKHEDLGGPKKLRSSQDRQQQRIYLSSFNPIPIPKNCPFNFFDFEFKRRKKEKLSQDWTDLQPYEYIKFYPMNAGSIRECTHTVIGWKTNSAMNVLLEVRKFNLRLLHQYDSGLVWGLKDEALNKKLSFEEDDYSDEWELDLKKYGIDEVKGVPKWFEVSEANRLYPVTSIAKFSPNTAKSHNQVKNYYVKYRKF